MVKKKTKIKMKRISSDSEDSPETRSVSSNCVRNSPESNESHSDKKVKSEPIKTRGKKIELSPELLELLKEESESSESSESSSSESEYSDENVKEYFEHDYSRVKDSLVKYIVSNFPRGERIGVKKRVSKGVEQAFDMFDEVISPPEVLAGTSPTSNLWKLGFGPNEIKKYEPILKKLRDDIKTEEITMKKILDSKLPTEVKKTTIKLFDILQNTEPYTSEYTIYHSQILEILKSAETDQITEEMVKQEAELKSLIHANVSLKSRILNTEIDKKKKAVIYDKYLQLEKSTDECSTTASIREWIENVLKIPFCKLKLTNNELTSNSEGMQNNKTLEKIKRVMDTQLYGMSDVKEQILCIFNNRLKNPNASGLAIGMIGSPGTGKCLHPDELVIMYSGELKRAKEVLPNDLLMGDDSTPRKVLSITSGTDKMYRIKPLDDFHDDYIINEPHILSLICVKKPKIKVCDDFVYRITWWELGEKKKHYVYTKFEAKNFAKGIKQDIIDISLTDYLNKSNKFKKVYKGYSVGVDFHFKQVENCVHNSGVASQPYLAGYQINVNHHLNKNYIYNTRTIRLQFLAGIIDFCCWGGTTSENGNCNCAINISTNKIDIIKFLIRSLGICVKQQQNNLFLSGDLTQIPCVKTNLSKFSSNGVVSGDTTTYDFDIQYLGIGNYCGFTIDCNRRFLLKDFTVTHNTQIARSLAESLDLPFAQISMGGMVDSSILIGQHQGWVGSSPGRIVKALQEMGVRNGIILLDEIDKLGSTPHGKEVQYSLLHITDPVQNCEFRDNYIGPELPIDLSNIIFVYAMNTTEGIDPALLSRLPIIKVADYNLTEKIEILKNYVLPQLLSVTKISPEKIIISDEVLRYLITKAEPKEGGVRRVKDLLSNIINKIGLLLEMPFEKQKELGISFACKLEVPVKLTNELVDKLYKETKNTSLDRMYL